MYPGRDTRARYYTTPAPPWYTVFPTPLVCTRMLTELRLVPGRTPPVKDLPALAWVALPGGVTLPKTVTVLRRFSPGEQGRSWSRMGCVWIAAG